MALLIGYKFSLENSKNNSKALSYRAGTHANQYKILWF